MLSSTHPTTALRFARETIERHHRQARHDASIKRIPRRGTGRRPGSDENPRGHRSASAVSHASCVHTAPDPAQPINL